MGDHGVTTSTALSLAKVTADSLRSKARLSPRRSRSRTPPGVVRLPAAPLASNDMLIAYCDWVDHNTFGVIIAPHRTQANAPAILNMVRAAVEH